MRLCKAVLAWLSCSLMLLLVVGCASLRKDEPLSSYSLPGDVDPDRGIISEITDDLFSSARARMGLGPNEDAAKQQFADAMSLYRDAGQLQDSERRSQFDKAAKAFAKSAARS